MRTGTMALLAAASLAGAAGTAAAETGYFEGVVGLAVPIADLNDDSNSLDYDTAFDESLKLGVRAGSGTGPSAFELTLDFTPLNNDISFGFPGGSLDVDVLRFRALAGLRHRTAVGKGRGVVVFGRVGAGLDVLHYGASGSFLGIEYERSETDPGLALEVGGGVAVRLGGKLYLGGQLALPMAFHFDDDDPNDAEDADLEYGGVDLDLLFTVGTRM